jgi:hypothetical protein
MLHHKFVSPHACLDNLSFEITFFKKSTWKIVDGSVMMVPENLMAFVDEVK